MKSTLRFRLWAKGNCIGFESATEQAARPDILFMAWFMLAVDDPIRRETAMEKHHEPIIDNSRLITERRRYKSRYYLSFLSVGSRRRLAWSRVHVPYKPLLSVFGSIWCVSEGTNATMSIFVQQNAFKEGFHSSCVCVLCKQTLNASAFGGSYMRKFALSSLHKSVLFHIKVYQFL